MKREADWRAGERGAVKITAVLGMLMAAAGIFVILKIVPVYVEQQGVQHDADELARIAAVRAFKNEKINEGIVKLIKDRELPQDSITILSHEPGRVQLSVNYTRSINLLVTEYPWQVQYVAKGKDL